MLCMRYGFSYLSYIHHCFCTPISMINYCKNAQKMTAMEQREFELNLEVKVKFDICILNILNSNMCIILFKTFYPNKNRRIMKKRKKCSNEWSKRKKNLIEWPRNTKLLHTNQQFTQSNKQKQLNHSQQIQFKLATSDDESKIIKYSSNNNKNNKQ